MAAVQDISDRQIAELVTNMARGRSVATTAARMHMAPNVVEEIGRLNGYPDTVELNRNARALNKRLRDAPPVEDLEADVPISVPREPEGSGSGVSVEVEEPEADEPDEQLWRCSRCEFDVWGPRSAFEDVEWRIAEHVATHVADQVVAYAASAPAHNHTDEEVRYPTCPACRAASEVPLVVLGDVVDDEPPARTNGHEPLKLAELLAPTRGFAHRLSSAESPSAEAHPSDVPAQPSEGVEELPAAPAPIPAGAGWLASGPRTVEQLLDEAEKSGSPRLMAGAAAVRETLQVLADLVDDWVAKADQRKAILHELDILGRRQDELTERLARLDAGIPELHPVDVGPLAWPGGGQVVSETPADWREAAAEVTQPIPEPAPAPAEALSRVEKLRALPFNQMSQEARARCKAWAVENGHRVASKGNQPKDTVEAYLAAHPEDDPR